MPSIETKPLPNFLVVGANKAGTTSLYHYLKQHPDIYLSPLKEPHYFSKDIHPEEFSRSFAQNKLQDIASYVEGPMEEYHAGFVREWEHYTKLFKNAEGKKAIGELSTSYLYSKVAAHEIRSALGDIKIIICLRNPIQRAYSHYRMNLWTGNSKAPTFMQALKDDEAHQPKVWGNAHLYVDIGKYYQQVKRYYDEFSSDNICIIFAEDLKNETSEVVKRLYNFLGVDSNFAPDTSEIHNEVFTPKFKALTWMLNATGIRPFIKRISGKKMKGIIVKALFKDQAEKGQLSSDERKYLNAIYKEDIIKLQDLIGRDLSHWIPTES